MFNNSKGKAKTPDGRPVSCVNKRLSGKKGYMRNNICGKRNDFSARTVIGAGPDLAFDEVGIPRSIAEYFTFPEIVTKHNKKWIFSLIVQGKANWLIKADKPESRKNIKFFSNNKGTRVFYGDIVVSEHTLSREKIDDAVLIAKSKVRPLEVGMREGEDVSVLSLSHDDVIIRDGKVYDQTEIKVAKGDIVAKGWEIVKTPIVIKMKESTKIVDIPSPLPYGWKRIDTSSYDIKKGERVIRNGMLIPVKYPSVNYEKIFAMIEEGDIIERQLINGDPVYFNRQPTLHKCSMRGLRIRIHEDSTFKFNLHLTRGFNAD